MSYWWVSQNRTFNEEKEGGYLWAPIKTKSGQRIYHWDTMKDLREGDIVFSYVKQKILAVSEVKGDAYSFKNPFLKKWTNDGMKVDLNYKVLQEPIILNSIVEELQLCLKAQLQYKPLNVNGVGHQGYLFPLIDDAGLFLLSKIGHI